MTPVPAEPEVVVTLAPCPFCGFKAYVGPHIDGSTCLIEEDGCFSIECHNCYAKGPLESSADEAVEAWSRLAAEAPLRAEIERLRGLLIDPGDSAWEDARAILATELRKANLPDTAGQVERAEGPYVPSWIALNLIAQARRAALTEPTS